MEFLPTVIEAVYKGGYTIKLKFNDGVEETIDFMAGWPGLRAANGCYVISRGSSSMAERSVAEWRGHRPGDASPVGEVVYWSTHCELEQNTK